MVHRWRRSLREDGENKKWKESRSTSTQCIMVQYHVWDGVPPCPGKLGCVWTRDLQCTLGNAAPRQAHVGFLQGVTDRSYRVAT